MTMSYDQTYDELEWFVARYRVLEFYDLYDVAEISDEIFEDICEGIYAVWILLHPGSKRELNPCAVVDWVTNQV
jgi:hypothetical protein